MFLFIRLAFWFGLAFYSHSAEPLTFADKVIDDIIRYRKDHVERFKDLSTLIYSDDWINGKGASVYQKCVDLLAGKEGLRKGPRNEKRYQKQVRLAIDFIQRLALWDNYEFEPIPDPETLFLSLLNRSLSSELVLSSERIQHVGFSVFFYLVSKWHIFNDLYSHDYCNETLYDFIKNQKHYADLGDKAQIFHDHISQKFKSDADMQAYITKHPFSQIWDENLAFAKVGMGLSMDPITIKEDAPQALNFEKVHFSDPQGRLSFGMRLEGTLRYLEGGGSCHYHVFRDAYEKIVDWDEGCDKKSREYLGNFVLGSIDNPLIRYWAARSCQEKLKRNISLGFDNLTRAWGLSSQKDESKLLQFLYDKNKVKAYVGYIVSDTSATRANDVLDNIYGYFNEWEIFLIGTTGDAKNVYTKRKLYPISKKKLWTISMNHLFYLENVSLTFKP